MFNRFATLFLVVYFITTSYPVIAGERNHEFNLDKNDIAIKGYDPVSYFSKSPEKGKETITSEYKGVQYLFANKDNLQLFKTDPEKYLPAYGGWCAWAMLKGKKVDINPERFKIINNINYLFYDGFWGNTLTKWNKLAETKTEPSLIRQADDFWQKISKDN
jgi:YHS domain-containing protein